MLEQFGGWPTLLSELCDGKNLTAEKTESVLSEILSGEADPSQISAFLVALKVKGETTEEITGLVRAMLNASEPLPLPPNAIDIVGTGGSLQRREAALNISTMASFVAAASGAIVCKHGNRRASSTSGAFDLLDALGLSVDQTPAEVAEQVKSKSLGFAFAKTFHPAMRFAGPVRAGIGVPTVFNILGPLSHPGRIKRHLIGTVNSKLGRQMAEVLLANGSKHAWIVTGDTGIDEISVTGLTNIVELKDEKISEWTLDPSDFGISLYSNDAIKGGSPEENAQIAIDVFNGRETGGRREMILLNASAGLVVGGVVENIGDGLKRTTEAVETGAVVELLDSLK
tara:strand:+ start:314 stop:1336 length:1023 start_codon:yes stop_codon:yes gene_type:complete